MQQLIAKEIKSPAEGQVSYVTPWIIPNWREVRQDVGLVKEQKATFETGQQPTQLIQTKWLVGMKDVVSGESTRARVYWQLLDIKGSDPTIKLSAEMQTQLCYGNGVVFRRDKQMEDVSLGEIFEEKGEYLDVGKTVGRAIDADHINRNGEVQYILTVTFEKPAVDSTHFEKLKMQKFSKGSQEKLRDNLLALLIGDSKGDLKIVTSDGTELSVHQKILKAQCPVFAAMLNSTSEFSESKTGIVKVDDISGKSMKILLHYFYTGDLQDAWRDLDTIVEFVYTVGKYQVTQVLELLDDLLGRNDQEDPSNLDVQLLNLTWKLSLKNAEARLLQRVITKISAANSSEELFQLFGYDSEEIGRRGQVLADQSVRASKVLEILEYAHGNNNEQRGFSDRGLTLLALVQGNGSLKMLEQILLKRFAEIASEFTTAEELFALFGDGNGKQVE